MSESRNEHRWWRNFKATEPKAVKQNCPYCGYHEATLIDDRGIDKKFRCHKCDRTYRVGKKGS